MRLSAELSQIPGVTRAMVGMGTDANLRMLSEAGLLAPQLTEARADDLIIAVNAADDETAQLALSRAEELLAEASRPRPTAGTGPRPSRTLRSAVASLGGAEV